MKMIRIACFSLFLICTLPAQAMSVCKTLWVDNQTGYTLHISGEIGEQTLYHGLNKLQLVDCHPEAYVPIGEISYDNNQGQRIHTGDRFFFNLAGDDNETNSTAVSANAFGRAWYIINHLHNYVYYYGRSTWRDTTLFGIEDPVHNGHYIDYQKYAPLCDEVACGLNRHLTTGALQGDHFNVPFRYQWRMVYSQTTPDQQYFWDPNDPSDLFAEPVPANAGNGDFVVKITELPKNVTAFDRLYVFGDSISDRQNLYSVTAGNLPRGVFYHGRFTDYLNWVDYFQLYTGVPIVDYAFGGSSVSEDIAANSVYQMWGFSIAGSAGLPVLPSLAHQFNAALPQLFADIKAGKKIGIVVFMGNNDFSHKLGSGEVIADRIFMAINNLKQTLTTFLGQPKQNVSFLVATLGNLGIAPTYDTSDEVRQAASEFSSGISKTINQEIEMASGPGFESYVLPIHLGIDLMSNQIGLYGYDPDSVAHPINHHMFGTFLDGRVNGVNLMGYSELNQYPGHGTTIHSRFKLLDVDMSQVNSAICAGLLHPSAKTQALLADNLLYNLMIYGLIDYDAPNLNQHLLDIISNSGMLNKIDPAAFQRLLDTANRQHYRRPDFANGFDNREAP